jgi:hypothetical protein
MPDRFVKRQILRPAAFLAGKLAFFTYPSPYFGTLGSLNSIKIEHMNYEEWAKRETERLKKRGAITLRLPPAVPWKVIGRYGNDSQSVPVELRVEASFPAAALAFVDEWLRQWHAAIVRGGGRWLDGPFLMRI